MIFRLVAYALEEPHAILSSPGICMQRCTHHCHFNLKLLPYWTPQVNLSTFGGKDFPKLDYDFIVSFSVTPYGSIQWLSQNKVAFPLLTHHTQAWLKHLRLQIISFILIPSTTARCWYPLSLAHSIIVKARILAS